MARKSERREYRMTISEFHQYLREKSNELALCYNEVEEVQKQFNGIFREELEAWKEQFTYCFPRVGAMRRELPAPFAQQIDQAEQEELARIRKEIDDLEQEIETARVQADELMGRGQDQTEALRLANPEINTREEELKALMVRYEDEYAEAYEQLESLEAGLGWLTNGGRIRKLRQTQREAKRRQSEVLQELRQVRQQWLKRVEEAGAAQAEFRETWQQASIRASQAQARRDHLVGNLDDLAQQGALQQVLENLDEDPQVPEELGDALRDLIERNRVRRAYEQGLKAVAEALGLMKGIGEGVERFARSVGTVVDEQRQFNLKQVSVVLPEWVINVHETWQALRARVEDEKHMGAHPLEFSTVVQQYLHDRLSNEIIQRMFETMGDALNAATRAWK